MWGVVWEIENLNLGIIICNGDFSLIRTSLYGTFPPISFRFSPNFPTFIGNYTHHSKLFDTQTNRKTNYTLCK